MWDGGWAALAIDFSSASVVTNSLRFYKAKIKYYNDYQA
jgi:hypothetical protein